MTSEQIDKTITRVGETAEKAGINGDGWTPLVSTLAIAVMEVAYQLAVMNERGITNVPTEDERCRRCSHLREFHTNRGEYDTRCRVDIPTKCECDAFAVPV